MVDVTVSGTQIRGESCPESCHNALYEQRYQTSSASQMAPTFSKVAMVANPQITVISGLRCGHAGCYALFSTIEDSEEHALNAHSGNVVAVTCNIHEKKMESGRVQLYRVLDEDGGDALQDKYTGAYYGISESVATGDDGNGRLQTEDKMPSVLQETAPTPPASQSTASTSLSRQSTEPAIDTVPFSSSFSSSSSTSFSSVSSDSGDIGDQVLGRILAAVQEIVGECRICWVQRDTTRRPHRTFRCSTGICSGNNWGRFKVGLQFPKNVVCYFCLSPYGPPFDHTRAPAGTKQTSDHCEYPDVLKELVYILYQEEVLRKKIFTRLGVAEPSSLSLYQRFISKRHGGIYGAYEVVNAFLELRESGEA
jgi:hypothetical protein